uniref:Uncharacterized protein n=1 Tax=Rhizophora mucronata TaxID=61149 RepID=A0A2P2J1Y6_RHIMU
MPAGHTKSRKKQILHTIHFCLDVRPSGGIPGSTWNCTEALVSISIRLCACHALVC